MTNEDEGEKTETMVVKVCRHELTSEERDRLRHVQGLEGYEVEVLYKGKIHKTHVCHEMLVRQLVSTLETSIALYEIPTKIVVIWEQGQRAQQQAPQAPQAQQGHQGGLS